jgi:hypothetical protein
MTSSISVREPTKAVQAAIDAFNRGDVGALIPRQHANGRRSGISPDATTTAVDERPISVRHMSGLDARRVFCALVTAHGNELVGVYSLTNGRIAQARHYFSDVDLLVSVGILDHDDDESSAQGQSSR